MVLEQSYTGALIAGLASFLSPCVLPLVPAYLCFLTGSDLSHLTSDSPDHSPARQSVVRAFWFVCGFATVFVLLGATASYMGRLLSQWYDTLAIGAGLLLVLLGANFLGLFRISLFMREARFQTPAKPVDAIGAYFVGLAFAFGWTPCVGPVLAAILILAGATETSGQGMGLLLAYALGLGIPFLLAAFFVRPFMAFLMRFRIFIGVFEKIVGIALLSTGALIMTGRFSVIGNWLIELFPSLNDVG